MLYTQTFRLNFNCGSIPVKLLLRKMSAAAGLHGRTLKAPWLLSQKAYVNGQWVDAKSNKNFLVDNPASGKIIGSVPSMDSADVEIAIDSAHKAFQTWKRTTAKERAILLRKWFSLVEENKEDLSIIMTAEAGKPLAEARGEVSYGSSFLEFYSEEARRIGGEIISPPLPNREMLLTRHPIGVAGMITPWNFPNAMITRKAGAAMAAGCTCIVKPAEDTPYSALALAALADKAGIPPGVFNVITSDRPQAAEVGKLLCTSPKIAGISFTGEKGETFLVTLSSSTAVGKTLYRQCADGVKRIGLELGGNAPFIVFDSADVKVAVSALMVAKFRNSGQTCISANRILVQSSIYDEFVAETVKAVSQLKVGDGMEEGVNIGPLINEPQMKKVTKLVESTIAAGAEVLIGGKPATSHGELYFEPTVLAGVESTMPCFSSEIFGPVVALKKFSTEEEALEIANDSVSGLAGYFFSQDLSQVWRVARNLEVGMVGINEGLISATEAAFGGIKESGLGREGSHHGIDDYTYIKYLCMGNIKY